MTPWFLVLGWVILLPMLSAAADASRRPVVLHAFQGRDARTNGPFGSALRTLATHFDVRPVRAGDLAAVEVPTALWLNSFASTDEENPPAGPTPAPRLSVDDVLPWVARGGGLVVMAEKPPGQPGSTLARDLLRRLEIAQSARKTGAKILRIPNSHPFLGGLAWSSLGFTLMDAPESPALQRLVLLPNDLSQFPLTPQAPDFAGLAMICGDFAEGRIALLADARWPMEAPADQASPAPESRRDHAAILLRLFQWVSRTVTLESPPSPSDRNAPRP